MRFISTPYRLLIPALAAAILLTFNPSSSFAQSGASVTKGAFVERFFLNKFSRSPSARRYVPADVENLSPAERYAAVVQRLNEKGVILLTGSNPEDLLTRVEYITLTYLLAGGVPGKSFAEMKIFLKERGAIDANDIGFIKAFQGDSTVTREGTEDPLKITGAEPVQFLDLDETEFGARIELQFDDGSTITIGEDTALTIDEMVFDPKTNLRKISLRLTVGTMRVTAAKNTNPNSSFNVITPTSIAGVRGTEFNVSVAADGATRIITFEGAVGVRVLLPSEARPESRAEARPGAKPGVKAGDPSAPAEEPAEEVVVEAGQTMAMEAGATAVGQLETATQEQIQEANTSTEITEPATVASVSAAETNQTDTIVQVKITESTTNVVKSSEETAKLTEEKPIEDDKGEATNEVNTTGSGSGLTTPTSPKTSSDSLTGLSGADLKSTFLALSATDQANRFGTLNFTQQKDLLSRLTQSEAQKLLAVFKPSSPFTAVVLDSLLDFGAAASAVQVGQLIDNVTAAQAVAFENCNESVRRCLFETGSVTGELVTFFTSGSFTFSDELTASGKVVTDALTLELARLAKAGGTIAAPGAPSVQLQMLLPTASDDFLFSKDPTLDTGSFIDFFVADEILFIFEDQIPDNIGITNQVIQDAFNGGLRPAVYSVNGGFQAGQLRASALGVIGGGGTALIDTATRRTALNNNGFLAYAVQVEEDILNAGVLAVRAQSTSLNQFPQGAIDSLIDSQIDFSNIRARDGLLAQQADARAGLVTFATDGSRVRVQQYIYRPPSNPDELRMLSISQFGEIDPVNDQGLSYVDLRVVFDGSNGISGKSSIAIRNLPWNSYFTFGYNASICQSPSPGFCLAMVGSPVGSPLLSKLAVEMGNDSRDFIREEVILESTRFDSTFGESIFNFAGTQLAANFSHQHPTQLRLLTKKSGVTARTFVVGDGVSLVFFDPRAGSSSSFGTGFGGTIPSGEFRVIPDKFGVFTTNAGDPQGFNYVGNDAGTNRFYPLQFSVLGDSTTSANAGRQTTTCGSGGSTACNTLKFDTIWDAFRINMDNSLNNPQALPTINIGANVLQIKAASVGGGQQVLSLPIINVVIPWPRMIWRGESNF